MRVELHQEEINKLWVDNTEGFNEAFGSLKEIDIRRISPTEVDFKITKTTDVPFSNKDMKESLMENIKTVGIILTE